MSNLELMIAIWLQYSILLIADFKPNSPAGEDEQEKLECEQMAEEILEEFFTGVTWLVTF